MASSSIALFLSLTMIGVEGGAVLKGEVVAPDGRGIAGVELVAAGDGMDGGLPSTIGRATSSEAGRFSMELAHASSVSDRPGLWAIAPGMIASSMPIERDMVGGRPSRLVLVPAPEGALFVVAGPDGRPIEGARISARRVAREVADVPDPVANATSATTDLDGRAALRAFRPEEVLEVRVHAAGFGLQDRSFRESDGMSGLGPKGITLRAVGKVEGRVVAEDAGAVAGLTVRVATSGEGRGSPDVGFGEATTDASGHFELPAIAIGSVTIRVRPRAGSPDLPALVVRRTLEPGRSLEVEIPLRRGVKVGGLAVDASDGRAIPGVVVSVEPSGSSEPIRVRTDDHGRYQAFVPSGLVTHRISSVPAPYLCPPSFVGPRPVDIPPAIARFELPRIVLTRGTNVRGSVKDQLGRAVAGARVEACWTFFDGRLWAPMTVSATSTGDGSFDLEPVPSDAEISLVASTDQASTDRPIAVRPVEGKAIGLVVVEVESSPLEGRVTGPDGRGLPGASVRIRDVVHPSTGGSERCKTNASGHFRTTSRFRLDREYLALADLEGHLAAKTPPSRPGSRFPDLVLLPGPKSVAIEGRVVDRMGRPIPGVRVWTSNDGPRRIEATSDLDGRFRLTGLSDHLRFLFAEAVGYRFQGRSIDSTARPLEWTLTRLDEDPVSSMASLATPSGGVGLARQLLAPYLDRVLSEGDHASRFRVLEILAKVDPRRVLALVEARGVEDAWFADHLRHVASSSLADSDAIEGGRMAIVASIRDVEWRVLATLDVAGSLPESAGGRKRELIDQALRDARSLPEPAPRLVALARVADRLIGLGEVDRASRLFEQARADARSLSQGGPGGRARVAFAESLARVDPVGALALTDEIIDPIAFDRCRLVIAMRVAAKDPAEASRILESLRNPRSMASALPALCHALAPVDPDLARNLIARGNIDDPCVSPYALGMMALAIAGRDKVTATGWLRESFDRLAVVGESASHGTSNDPAAVAAALLPVAERIDPRLVPEFLWKAVSLHEAGSSHPARSDARLALLLSRYDRGLARRFLEPIPWRPSPLPETDLAPTLAAAAAIEPELSLRLVEALPEPPSLTYHHPKNQARLELAASLARGGPSYWDEATIRFLRLWTEASPGAD